MLFEDTFEVTAVNPDGKKFDRVTRIVCRGENYDMALVLDYNSQIYRLPLQCKFLLLLARTLNLGRQPGRQRVQPGRPAVAHGQLRVRHARQGVQSHAGAGEGRKDVSRTQHTQAAAVWRRRMRL